MFKCLDGQHPYSYLEERRCLLPRLSIKLKKLLFGLHQTVQGNMTTILGKLYGGFLEWGGPPNHPNLLFWDV